MKLEPFNREYVRLLTDGDPRVEEHFAAYFGSLLYLKLRVRLRAPELIEDIRQETLARVLEILRVGPGVKSPERFGAFVNAVCNNVARERLRSDNRLDPLDELAEGPIDASVDMDAPLVNADLKRKIARVMSQLPEKDRNLLQAVYLDETDKAEICRRYHVEPGYLRVMLHRAKARFREACPDLDGLLPLSPHTE